MNSTEKRLPQKVLEFLKTVNLTPQTTLVVALSGGPDSTALLLSLCELQNSIGCTIKAAYVNHGMRKENQLRKDDEFVKEITSQHNIELFSLRVKPGEIEEISSKERRSSEEVARSFRYSFFEKILVNFDHPFLLLGHNRDDQYETIICRFFQGSGISGLKGIPHRNNQILRPLINCSKKEILQYLVDSGQQFRTDPTNDENIYQRNRVRNKLIPLIEEIFPGYSKSLNAQEERFLSLNELIETESDKLQCTYRRDYCSVPLDLFNSAHNEIRRNILFRMFDHTYRGDISGFRIPARFFNSLLSKNLDQNRVFGQSYGFRIFSDNHSLIFANQEELDSGFFYELSEPGIEVPGKFKIILGEREIIKIETIAGSPLLVRSAEIGDYIESDGKTETIKSLFKKWNVKSVDQNLIPLIVDSAGIIAVLGDYIGYKNKIRNKKNNFSEKFNILYLGVRQILQK